MIRFPLLATVIALSVAACGESGTASEPVAGTYTLQAYAGQPLPVTVMNSPRDGVRQDLVAGTFTLRADATFLLRDSLVSYRNDEPQSSAISEWSGTYVQRGDSLLLTGPAGMSPVGLIGNDRLVLKQAAYTTYEYRRQ